MDLKVVGCEDVAWFELNWDDDDHGGGEHLGCIRGNVLTSWIPVAWRRLSAM